MAWHAKDDGVCWAGPNTMLLFGIKCGAFVLGYHCCKGSRQLIWQIPC